MRLCIIPILASAILAVPASAESKFDSKPAHTRTCRIVFPGQPNDAPKHAFLFDGKESHRVDLPSMNFSKVIALPEGELTLFLTPTKINQSKDLPQHAPKLVVEKEISEFYILVSSDPTNPVLPLKLRKIDTSKDKLKKGETLWLNQTSNPITAQLGEQEFTISANSRTISTAPLARSGYYRAEFKFQPHGKGELKKITEQQWWYDARSKHIGFIVSSGGRLPKIYFYRDFRP